MFGSSGFRTAKLLTFPLLNQIDQLLGRDDNAEFDFDSFLNLLNPLSNFENALLSEAAMADVYYVLEKEPYSTLSLATKGETLFPPQTIEKVPEATADLQAAGQCIAFELPTAAAFHILRATEAVLRRYWASVAGNVPKPKLRTVGVFLAALRKHELGDNKVIAALGQMNELHRNPTIHPDENLNLDEAIALLGIANSVVASMLKVIPKVIPDEPELPGIAGIAVPSGRSE